MAIETRLKRWGNSMAIIIPNELILRKNLQENENIVIEIVKKADLSDIFGSIKKRKLSGQEFKDMVREGWRK